MKDGTATGTGETILLDEQVVDILESIDSLIGERVPVTGDGKGATPVASPDAPSDADWAGLPKQSFDYCTFMRFGAAGVSVDRLFRHPALNPLDKVMSISERNQLRDFVETGMKEVNKLTQLRGTTISRSMTDMIARGLTKTRSPTQGEDGVTEFDGSEVGHVTRIVDGVMHTAAQTDMPMVAQLTHMEEYASISMAAAIASWFHNRGFCPERSYSAIIAKLSKTQERFPPRPPKRKDRGK